MIMQYKDIEYTLRRSERKTASIYIERDGRVSVLVPKTLPEEKVHRLIESKRYWIYKGLAEWRDLNAASVTREYVNGEGFLYLGRSYRLNLVRNQAEPLLLKDGYFCLRRELADAGTAKAKEAFRQFYREKGLKRLGERVRYYEAKMGVRATGVKVVELRNRWASCTSKGILNFHWKVIMMPMTILDYIVVHELAHLIHANHTKTFWNEVDTVMPDYLERKTWLRVHGADMSL